MDSCVGCVRIQVRAPTPLLPGPPKFCPNSCLIRAPGKHFPLPATGRARSPACPLPTRDALAPSDPERRLWDNFMSDCASFWYADSDSTIKSRYVPINSKEFIMALMCLARADATLLGYSPRFRTNGTVVISNPIEGAQFTYSSDISVPNPDVYPLRDVISHARAMHGRCSRVLGLTFPENQDCVLKLSHQVVTRTNEAEMIKRAHERKIDGVIKLIFSIDLEKLSDGPRSRLPPGLVSGVRQDLLAEDRVLCLLVLPRCMPLYQVLNRQHFMMALISLLKS
jgi:hypothetical protein